MDRPSPPLVLVLEPLREDEIATIKALEAVGLPNVSIERARTPALARIRNERPGLLIVADDFRACEAGTFVRAAREAHGPSLPILHLRSSEGCVPAEGADAWLLKPIDFDEYRREVGEAARRLLGGG